MPTFKKSSNESRKSPLMRDGLFVFALFSLGILSVLSVIESFQHEALIDGINSAQSKYEKVENSITECRWGVSGLRHESLVGECGKHRLEDVIVSIQKASPTIMAMEDVEIIYLRNNTDVGQCHVRDGRKTILCRVSDGKHLASYGQQL